MLYAKYFNGTQQSKVNIALSVGTKGCVYCPIYSRSNIKLSFSAAAYVNP